MGDFIARPCYSLEQLTMPKFSKGVTIMINSISKSPISSTYNTSKKDSDLDTAVFDAIFRIDHFKLKQLLAMGANANATERFDSLNKFYTDNPEICSEISEAKSYMLFASAGGYGLTRMHPLAFAFYNEDIDSMRILIEYGAKILDINKLSVSINDLSFCKDPQQKLEIISELIGDSKFDGESNLYSSLTDAGVFSVSPLLSSFELQVFELFHQNGLSIEDLIKKFCDARWSWQADCPQKLLELASINNNRELVSFLKKCGYNLSRDQLET